MKNNKKPEVLAPAGSMESIYAAVRCGADGIYVGGKDFSARANAVNFSDDELKDAVRYCHLHEVKIYRAMNTVIFDSEAEEFVRQVRFSAEAGIDGLIIQDMGAAFLARAAAPDMPLHASTQLTVHTPLGAELAEKCGFCRVVPARELSLDEIRDICSTGVETEVFVHGAQCMCLSGQCYMSAFIGGRSANRGQCAQACRLPFCAKGSFSARGKEEYYALSLKDMSLTEHIDSLISAGCASFKIEGRMKRPEYVAAAVTAFRHITDGERNEDDIRRLGAVFSRSGFTDGYLTKKLGRDMFGSRRKEDVISADTVLSDLSALYRNEKKSGVISFSFVCEEGKETELSFDTGKVTGSVKGNIPERALKRALAKEDVSKQLTKLGGTSFEAGEISCLISEGVTLPAAEINRLRREAVQAAEELTVKANTHVYTLTEFVPERIKADNVKIALSLRIRAEKPDAFSALKKYAELFMLPMKACGGLSEEYIPMTAAELPDIVSDEGKLIKELEGLAEKGFTHFVCGNFTHLGALLRIKEKYPLLIHGGTGLNITNSYSARAFAELGLTDITVSPEMMAGQFSDMEKPVPTGFYAYGNFPLMTVKNCPVKAQVGCGGCKGSITDRTGRTFPVRCYNGYARIFNCQPTDISDRLKEFSGAAFGIIDIGDRSLSEAVGITERYIGGAKPEGEYTRGLYFRGVK